jgi:hypothetical protein
VTGLSSPPTAFGLRLPDSWYELDIWRATRTGDLARWVDSRIAAEPALKPWRGPLLSLLRDVAGRAQREGALYCAALTEPVEDAGTIAASVMVFQTDGAADPDGNAVEAIASRITATAPADDSEVWRTVSVVDLPAGRAVRVRGVETADLSGGASAECVVVQTLFPVPDGGGVLAVVCTSPQTGLAEPLLDLFEAISDTLSWSYEHVRPE